MTYKDTVHRVVNSIQFSHFTLFLIVIKDLLKTTSIFVFTSKEQTINLIAQDHSQPGFTFKTQ